MTIPLLAVLLLTWSSLAYAQCDATDLCCDDPSVCCEILAGPYTEMVRNDWLGWALAQNSMFYVTSVPKGNPPHLSVFNRGSGTLVETINSVPNSGFGFAVGINENGWIAVSYSPTLPNGRPSLFDEIVKFDAPASEAVELFGSSPPRSLEQTITSPSIQGFGSSISMNDDTLAIGGQNGFEVYNFVSGGTPEWQRINTMSGAGTYAGYGWAVELSSDSLTLAVGNPEGDSVEIWKRSSIGSSFSFSSTIDGTSLTYHNDGGNQYFGWSLSFDAADTLTIGAPHDSPTQQKNFGHAFIFERSGSVYTKLVDVYDLLPTPIDEKELGAFGYSLASSLRMNLIGAPLAKAASEGVGRIWVVAPRSACLLGQTCSLIPGSGNAANGHSLVLDGITAAGGRPFLSAGGQVQQTDITTFGSILGEVDIFCNNPMTCESDGAEYCLSCGGEMGGIIIDVKLFETVDITSLELLNHGTGTKTALTIPNSFPSTLSETVPAGSYSVIMNTDRDCEVESNILVIAAPVPLEVSAAINLKGCNHHVSCHDGDDGTATATATGGCEPNTGYTYIWSNGQTSATATDLGLSTFTVTASDAFSCTDSTDITLDNNPPEWTVSIDLTCDSATDQTRLSFSTLGGCTLDTQTWSTSGGGSLPGSDSDDEQFPVTATGIYEISVTDTNSCVATDSIEAGTSASIVCASQGSCTCVACNGGVGELEVTVTLPSGETTTDFTWSGPTGTVVESDTTFSLATAGTWDLVVSSSYTCDVTSSFVVTEPDPLEALITPVCNTASAGLFLDGDTIGGCGMDASVDFAWSTTDGSISGSTTTQQITAETDGSYVLTVTDDQGCMASLTETVLPISVGAGLTDLTFWSSEAGSFVISPFSVTSSSDNLHILKSDYSDTQSTSFIATVNTPASGNGAFGVFLGCEFTGSDDCVLIDWNNQESLRISRVTGSASATEYLSHTGSVSEVANLAIQWLPSTTYTLYVEYYNSFARMYIDDGTNFIEVEVPANTFPDGPTSLYSRLNGVEFERVRRSDLALTEAGATCGLAEVTLEFTVSDFLNCGSSDYEFDVEWGDGNSDNDNAITFAANSQTVDVSIDHTYSSTGLFLAKICVRDTNAVGSPDDCDIRKLVINSVSYSLIAPGENTVYGMYSSVTLTWSVGSSPVDTSVRIEMIPVELVGSAPLDIIVIEENYPIGTGEVSYSFLFHHFYTGTYKFRVISIPGGCPFVPEFIPFKLIAIYPELDGRL